MNRGSNVRNNFPGSIKTTCNQQKWVKVVGEVNCYILLRDSSSKWGMKKMVGQVTACHHLPHVLSTLRCFYMPTPLKPYSFCGKMIQNLYSSAKNYTLKQEAKGPTSFTKDTFLQKRSWRKALIIQAIWLRNLYFPFKKKWSFICTNLKFSSLTDKFVPNLVLKRSSDVEQNIFKQWH